MRAEIGRGDLEYFAEIGLTGPWLVLAHCVWLTEAGMRRVARSGTHVTHCPASNLKLASGLAPGPRAAGSRDQRGARRGRRGLQQPDRRLAAALARGAGGERP